MSPERLEIARRTTARLRPEDYLPGMQVIDGDGQRLRLNEYDPDSGCWFCDPVGALGDGGARVDTGWYSTEHWTLDLDDEVTRLGVLAVVRRAHRDESCGLAKSGDRWVVTMGVVDLKSGERWMAILRDGPTEEVAMLAALEAAP